MSITIGVIFSIDSVGLFEIFGLKNIHVLNDLKTFTFDNHDEVNAFLHGVDDSVGYHECKIRKAKPGSIEAQVAFIEEGESVEYLKIKQASVAERIAYEAGVEACEGWYGYKQLSDDELDNYLQAKAAAGSTQANQIIRFIQTAVPFSVAA
jgi:hypothetical protein